MVVEEATAHKAADMQDRRVVRGRAQEVVVCQQVVVEAEHRAVERRRVRSHRDLWLSQDGLKVLPSQAAPLREGLADAFLDSSDADGFRVGVAESEANPYPRACLRDQHLIDVRQGVVQEAGREGQDVDGLGGVVEEAVPQRGRESIRDSGRRSSPRPGSLLRHTCR